MSYELELRADVQKRFRALPFDVQEALLDLFDELVATASPAALTLQRSIDDHTLSFEGDTASFQVFFTVDSDHVNRRLIGMTLWYVGRI